MGRSIYINGKMVPESKAAVSLFDVGRLYGATFYESIRTFRHQPFKLEEHIHRLERSLRYAGFLHYLDVNRVTEAVEGVLGANLPLVEKEDDIWMCVEVTPGNTFPMPILKQENTTPSVFAYTFPLPFHEYVSYYTEGKPLVTSQYRNIPPQCYEQRCKNRSRLPHFLSKLHGMRSDPKAFALMLDLDGYITETTGANIFFTIDEVLYTPTTRNILNGISRQYVLHLAERGAMNTIETDLTLYDAYNADEAFLTTSSYCILPVSTIDGKKIGVQCPGSRTKALLDAWSDEVGVDIIGQAQRFKNRKV
jgi:branched-chain amino acid aminotransferase